MEVETIKTGRENIEIKRATILTEEEAKQIPEECRKYREPWWLQSPGTQPDTVAYVSFDGTILSDGQPVNCKTKVRPALVLADSPAATLEVGDKFIFDGKPFEVIGDRLALCLTDIGTSCFHTVSNQHHASDLKAYTEDWFRKANDNMRYGTKPIGIKILGASLYSGFAIQPHLMQYCYGWWWCQQRNGDKAHYYDKYESDVNGKKVPNYNFRYGGMYIDRDGRESKSTPECGHPATEAGYVRPCLSLSGFQASRFKVGDVFVFGGKGFVIVNATRAICRSDIGTCCFCEDKDAEYPFDYESSDIKKYIDAWFTEAMNELEKLQKAET